MSTRVRGNVPVARPQASTPDNAPRTNAPRAGDAIKRPGAATPSGDSFVPGAPSLSGRPQLNPGATPAGSAAAASAVNNHGKVDASRVPFISQYSPAGKNSQYTNGDSNCGPTSMAMIARAFGYGQHMTDAQLINHLGGAGGTTEDGTNVNGILAMAQAMGKKGEMKGPGADVNWIAHQLEQGKMVVANLDYYATAGHQEEGRTSGHYVTVAGMDAQGHFLMRDPADPNVKTLTPRQLAHAISHNPNGGYQFAIG